VNLAILNALPVPLMDDVKEQLKVLILSSLRITDVSPAELSDDRVLMGGDLEIDSIDVLQLILEIERHFGIKLVKGGKFEKAEWATVGTLADAIEARLVEATKK
jgi:acyl carrier protein